MSALTIIEQLETNLSEEELITALKAAISKDFEKVKIKRNKKTGALILSCCIKTKLLNSIVSIKGVINIRTKGEVTKIMIDVDTETNLWFWLDILLGFVPPFTAWLWVVSFWQWHFQKRLSMEALQNIGGRLKFQLET